MATLFEGIAQPGVLQPLVAMEDPYHYRDKVISPYAWAPGAAAKATASLSKKSSGARRRGAGGRAGSSKAASQKQPLILTGMYARGTHQLIPTSTCAIENEHAKEVTLAIRSIMERYGMEPYDEDKGTGFVRHSMVRVGHESGEVLVTLVTNGREFPASKAFCRELVKRCPFVTTVVQNINERQTNVILGSEERVLYGPGFILDRLCGLSFRISSQSFYQVNARQTEVLYREAMTLAGLGPESQGRAPVVIDAYCGTGTIGLVAAHFGARAVIGVDSVASAIADARLNARHNGIENAQFVEADATAFMEALAAEGATCLGDRANPEELVVFMDPPRAGSTPEFLSALAALNPATVVYISCDPTTQVRDLRMLLDSGFRLESVVPVDMFPHTDHIESIALLRGACYD